MLYIKSTRPNGRSEASRRVHPEIRRRGVTRMVQSIGRDMARDVANTSVFNVFLSYQANS